MEELKRYDEEIFSLIERESIRQREKVELIASENFVSRAVLEAVGSPLTNKYAEGYPDARYYGGCEYVDQVENLAIERAKALFKTEYANVQPHSGSQANMAVYMAAVPPGGTILAMDLTHGGHLTHGSRVNFSGQFYHFIHYGVQKSDELIDYQMVEDLATEHRPTLIIAGGSAYPRTIDFEAFSTIASKVGASLMVDMAHFAGFVATGLFPDPVPLAHYVTTTTHKTLRGIRGGLILSHDREKGEKVDKALFPGIQGGPLMHSIAAKAVGFKEALHQDFKMYQRQVLTNARELAKGLKEGGLRLISGGTDTHLLLVDVTPLGLTGKEAEERLDDVGITVNKNTIPFEKKRPVITSGIRLGTPAITTRGMREDAMDTLSLLIIETLKGGNREKIKREVYSLSSSFPLRES